MQLLLLSLSVCCVCYVGVTKVLNSPPSTLLGAAAEFSAIPVREVEFSPEPQEHSSVLLVENLPSDIPENMVKMQFQFMFKSRGYEVTECRIDKRCAYFMFKDTNG